MYISGHFLDDWGVTFVIANDGSNLVKLQNTIYHLNLQTNQIHVMLVQGFSILVQKMS